MSTFIRVTENSVFRADDIRGIVAKTKDEEGEITNRGFILFTDDTHVRIASDEHTQEAMKFLEEQGA